MNFGKALELAKQGRAVAREGWNGKGMWVTVSPGQSNLPYTSFWAEANREFAESHGGAANVLPCMTMRTVNGEIMMGWSATQTDMLSEDWSEVEPK